MTPYGLKITVGNRRVHEHVLIAERALGKRLPRRAQVHHVDGNQRNNANSNLVICQDAAYHQLLHARMRVKRAGGDPHTQHLCCTCLQPRAFDRFYVRKDRPGRHSSECIDCGAARYQRRRGPRKISPLYKLTSPDTRARVKELIASGMSQRQVAAVVGVRQCSISDLLRRMQ